jgi:uncharacterized protein (PEP-CTERM system associated)
MLGIRPALRALAFTCLIVGLGGNGAQAAETRLTQGAGLEVGVTDNVDLEPDESAREAVVTTLSHRARLSLDGNRLDFDLDSDIELDVESSRGDVTVDQDVRALGNVEVVPDWFFVDVLGSSRRQLVNNTSGVSASGRARGEDRATVNIVEASPYISRSIGSYARGELRLRHTETFVSDSESTSADLSDRRIDQQQLAVASGPRLGRYQLRGEVSHRDSRSVREDGDSDGEDDDLETFQGAVTTVYALSPHFAVLATVGGTDVNADDERDLSGPLWDVGVEVEGKRLQGAATVGRRYGENRATLDAVYQPSPKTFVEAQLTRELDTSQGAIAALNRERIADPTPGAVFPGEFRDDLEEGIALSWRGRLKATTRIGRNTLRLDFRFIDREFEDDSDRTFAARLFWERSLSRHWRTRVSLLGRQTTENDVDDTLLYGTRLELVRTVSRNAEIYFGVSRSDQDSDIDADNYTENAAFIGGRIGF